MRAKMNDYKAECDARRVASFELASKIARAMNPPDAPAGWLEWVPEMGDADGRGEDADLIGPRGLKLHLTVDGYGNKGRVEISGSRTGLYNFLRSEEWPRSITVTKEKAPEKIAADIKRRLLPKYEVAFKKATEAKAKADDTKAKAEDALLEVMKVCGESELTDRNRNERTAYPRKVPGVYSVRVYEFDPPAVKLELDSMPVELAKEVLAVLARRTAMREAA